jgi:thymidylate synthase ThyX
MPEAFFEDERQVLSPFFTNTDRDVFGLRLPQEVAGALFSRYSRSAKSLRRVFLEEFHGREGLAAGILTGGPGTPEDRFALRKARAFYDRVLVGYGDDSVAQLGGAHMALEGISNVAAKTVEDSRVGIAFLEKSTRYVRFDQKDAAGGWLFHPEERLCSSPHREAFLTLMEGLFSAYAAQIEPMLEGIRNLLPIEEVEVRHPATGEPLAFADVAGDEELLKMAKRAWGATVRAHACDVMRGYLPGATRTNVGVFASGQAYEHLINRLLSHPLGEMNALGGALKTELDEMIPAFVKRAQRSEYVAALRETTREMARSVVGAAPPVPTPEEPVRLLDFDADAEEKVLAALLYPHAEEPLPHLRSRVLAIPPAERARRMAELAALRRHRRDKPPRALEAVDYTFDLLGNFGIYRDLHRHRILSQERQLFTTAHGWDVPPEVDEIGGRALWNACMEEAASLHEKLRGDFPFEAQYVVPFAFRARWAVRMNLREAIHFCELRSMPQGHPDYRVLVQEMWRQIEAVHPSLACWGRFVNRDAYRLGRLQSEMRSEFKRARMEGARP